jgi:hypothetical protein
VCDLSCSNQGLAHAGTRIRHTKIIPPLVLLYHTVLITGPLFDETEKDRCALMMRYRGKPPAEAMALEATRGVGRPEHTHAKRRGAAQSSGAGDERHELEGLFNKASQEVQERQQFLVDMQAAGALTRELQHQVSALMVALTRRVSTSQSSPALHALPRAQS